MFKEIAWTAGVGWSLFYIYAWAHNDFKSTFTIERSVEIQDSAERVFSHILNSTNYPLGMVRSWKGIEPEKELLKQLNPLLEHEENKLKVGETKFQVDLITLGLVDVILSHWSVDTHSKQHFKFGWIGTSIHEKNFCGDHQFEVNAKGPSRCELVHREDISGFSTPLARLFHEWTGYIHYYEKYLREVKAQIEK
ncbi:hypothetical protein FDP41_009730 [Naegleria fowleri]|uniref:Coenzyme Q-binding protein COQ10 START domain-containing protein n=1 Tax=Naegleria fowleri TaxID=5763 RepID=A0A6A5BD74_NAEFO|nr:uncharacterized protein FDP41_009730 [Naegleria fowleri]KAF0972034.1 hypothetical protein FDP41_009730 [Naegleria fowleri]